MENKKDCLNCEKNVPYTINKTLKFKLYSSRSKKLIREGAALGYYILRTEEQIKAIENGPFRIPHENRSAWCHVYCYIMIEYRYKEVDPFFNGVCRKDCNDTNCTYKHGNY